MLGKGACFNSSDSGRLLEVKRLWFGGGTDVQIGQRIDSHVIFDRVDVTAAANFVEH